MEIQLSGLCKYFVGKDKKVFKAVNNMNLTVPSGKLIALLGPSGSGKTTMLNLIGGLDKQTKGKITINKKNLSKKKRFIR